jgi:hypothetical protein
MCIRVVICCRSGSETPPRYRYIEKPRTDRGREYWDELHNILCIEKMKDLTGELEELYSDSIWIRV